MLSETCAHNIIPIATWYSNSNPFNIHSHSQIFELHYYCNFADKYLANKPKIGIVFVSKFKHRLWIKFGLKTFIQLTISLTRTDEFNSLYSCSMFSIHVSTPIANKFMLQYLKFSENCKNLTLYSSFNWIYRISFRKRMKLIKSGFDPNINMIYKLLECFAHYYYILF